MKCIETILYLLFVAYSVQRNVGMFSCECPLKCTSLVDRYALISDNRVGKTNNSFDLDVLNNVGKDVAWCMYVFANT
jgi:hypothetical protein